MSKNVHHLPHSTVTVEWEEQPEAVGLSAFILIVFCLVVCPLILAGVWKVLLWATATYGLPF